MQILEHHNWSEEYWHEFSFSKGKIYIYFQEIFFPETLFNVRRVNFLLSQTPNFIEAVAGAETSAVDADQPQIIAPIQQDKPRENDQPQPDLIRWIAPDNAFADLIVELRKKGYIAATSDTEALNIAAPHFTDVNRDGDTLLQGVNNKEYLGTGRGKASFKEIPAASDLNPKKTQGNFSSIPQARRRRRSKAETK